MISRFNTDLKNDHQKFHCYSSGYKLISTFDFLIKYSGYFYILNSLQNSGYDRPPQSYFRWLEITNVCKFTACTKLINDWVKSAKLSNRTYEQKHQRRHYIITRKNKETLNKKKVRVTCRTLFILLQHALILFDSEGSFYMANLVH